MKHKFYIKTLVCTLLFCAIGTIAHADYDSYYPKKAGYNTPSPLNTYGASHIIKERSPGGETIEIEDDSGWAVHPNYQDIVASWEKNQYIQIRPRNNFWRNVNPLSWNLWGKRKKSYTYEIVYALTQEVVPVNLSLGPKKGSFYKRSITSMNPHLGIVYLNDNSAWQVSHTPSNHYRLSKYLLGDIIIVATNTGAGNPWSNSNILINVSDNSFVAASPYGKHGY